MIVICLCPLNTWYNHPYSIFCFNIQTYDNNKKLKRTWYTYTYLLFRISIIICVFFIAEIGVTIHILVVITQFVWQLLMKFSNWCAPLLLWAHLTKGHVRFCNHLASVDIRRSYSKHKLFSKILSSETIDLFDYFIIKFAFWIGIVQNIAYSIIIIRRFDYAALFY